MPFRKLFYLIVFLALTSCVGAQTWQELKQQALDLQAENPQEAIRLYERAIQLKEPKDDFDTAVLFGFLGKLEYRLGHYEKSLRAFGEAKSRTSDEKSRAYGEILFWMGVNQVALEQKREASESIQAALLLYSTQGWTLPNTQLSFELAKIYFAQGEVDKLQAHLDWVLQASKAGSFKTVDGADLHEMGIFANQVGSFRTAKLLFESALRKFQEQDSRRAIAAASFWLAICNTRLKNWEQVLLDLDQCQANNDDPQVELQVHICRGIALLELERAPEAIGFLLKVDQLDESSLRTLGYEKLGEAARFVGQESLALKSYSNALEKRPEDPDLWEQRGLCYLSLGENVKALADMDQSLALRDEGQRKQRGLTLSRRAQALSSLDRDEEALNQIRESLSILSEADQKRYGLVLNAASNILFEAGDYEMSLRTGERALEFYEKVQSLPRVLAQAYKFQASRLEALGRKKRALELFQQSHEKYTLCLGEDHPETINAGLQLASLQVDLGEVALGLDYYQRFIPKLDEQLKGDPRLAFARVMWAVALRRSGRLDEAIAQVKLAEAAQNSPYRRALMSSYLGTLERRSGNIDEAYELTSKAATTIKSLQPSPSIGLLGTYRDAGTCALSSYQKSGDKALLKESRSWFEEALKVAFLVRNRVDDSSRRIQSGKVLNLFPLAIEACVADGDLKRAIEIAELSSSRALLELLAGTVSASESGRSREQLRGVLQKSGVSVDSLATSGVVEPLGIASLNGVLNADEIALYLVVGPGVSHGFLFDGKEAAYFPMAPGEEIEKVAQLLTRQLARGRARAQVLGSTSVSDKKSRRLSEHLFSKFPAEWSARLKDKTLVMIPTGRLLEVPFEVLPPLPGQDGRYLIEKNPIIYTPSLSLLKYLRDRPNTASKKTALLLADPAYGGKATLQASRYRSQDSDLTFPLLPFTRDEAQSIAQELGPEQCTLVLGEEATEEKLKSQDLSQFQILHFACHGILGRNRETNPALVLAKTADPKEDGFLTMEEIQGLDKLTADLVVLSACQTGRGQFQAGEGVESLARSFLRSGAQAVLVSLWTVDDQSTSQLMTKFYSYLRKDKLAPSAALRQARLDLIKSGSPAGHWAPFILIGDESGFEI